MSKLDIKFGKIAINLVTDTTRDLAIFCGTALVLAVLFLFFTSNTADEHPNAGELSEGTQPTERSQSLPTGATAGYAPSLPKIIGAMVVIGAIALTVGSPLF
ncbi:hypothetical protein SAMN04487948_11659 [Halogranum amylolyticum]|uniref:Uncharacterized protein n=1 Tax=Halogranum amylolyticum TaxID=660520 RepID=A0A1H8VFQ9_9EURY|nr:hypothetical protein SAMN04487948_11659 [Halogranum amylolyticum]